MTSFGDELAKCAVYAAAAAAVLALCLWPPVGRALGALIGRVESARRGRFLVLLVLLTVGTRLALMTTFTPPYTTDAKEYLDKAVLIADEGSPRAQELVNGRPAYRTLGYSLALAGWFKATGTRSMLSARLFNVALAVATALLVVLLGETLRRPLAGRLAALLFAVHMPLLMFALTPYAETWAALLVVATTWMLARLWTGEGSAAARAGWGVALGLVGGLLVISRTEFVWAPPLCAGALLWRGRSELARWWAPAALSLVACALPFVVNHEMRAGYPGHLRTSTMGGRMLFFGNNPIEVNGQANATPAVVAETERMYAQDPTGELAKRTALEWMKANPVAVVGNAFKKLYRLWLEQPIGFGWQVSSGKPEGMDPLLAAGLSRLSWVQGLATLFAGLLALRAAYRGFWFPIALLLLHAAFWAIFATYSRYRYPVEPLVLFAAAVWLVDLTGSRAADSRTKA